MNNIERNQKNLFIAGELLKGIKFTSVYISDNLFQVLVDYEQFMEILNHYQPKEIEVKDDKYYNFEIDGVVYETIYLESYGDDFSELIEYIEGLK